jgi:hypothetical protein
METQAQNINVIRSAWRRIKKDIKVRDLTPVKDAKRGGIHVSRTANLANDVVNAILNQLK